MTRIALFIAAGALALTGAVPCSAAPAKDAAMPAPIVFFDIVGPELQGQAAFYRAIFGWDVGPDGGFSVPAASPLRANLRVEKAEAAPFGERVLYVGVADITATLQQITAHGGKVVFPRLEVPGVAVVALFTDPAGNRMGLVEMDGDHAKVPKAP